MRISKPQGDLSSWTWKARTKTARRLVAGSPSEFEGDDFDWRRYHREYAAQLQEIESLNTLRLVEGEWEIHDGAIVLTSGLPLHPNHRALYETILGLRPLSVLEAGCGGGDHLHNLSLLLPGADIRGIDRSLGQLGVLRHRNPAFADKASVVDLTLPHPTDVPRADVVYVQAVLMHIQTGNGHRVALWNLFDLARHQVVLMENLERHDLVADIRDLWARRILPWETLHLYQADESAGPPVVVASRAPLVTTMRELLVPAR